MIICKCGESPLIGKRRCLSCILKSVKPIGTRKKWYYRNDFKKQYSKVHYWLRKNFGPANKCENINCSNISKTKFQWACLHEKKYKKKRDSFIMLCVPCHEAYDHLLPGNKLSTSLVT